MRRKGVPEFCTYLEGPRREQVFKESQDLRTESRRQKIQARRTSSLGHGVGMDAHVGEGRWMPEYPTQYGVSAFTRQSLEGVIVG